MTILIVVAFEAHHVPDHDFGDIIERLVFSGAVWHNTAELQKEKEKVSHGS